VLILIIAVMLSITQIPGINNCHPAFDEPTAKAALQSVKQDELIHVNTLKMNCDVWE
jgi:hypothetical protein